MRRNDTRRIVATSKALRGSLEAMFAPSLVNRTFCPGMVLRSAHLSKKVPDSRGWTLRLEQCAVCSSAAAAVVSPLATPALVGAVAPTG